VESDAFTAHTGRASKLGGIVNPVDRRRPSLSRLERRHISRAKLVARSTIDMPSGVEEKVPEGSTLIVVDT